MTATRAVYRCWRAKPFFEVESDPARPFTVAVHAFDATALGTKFNVRESENDVSVTVAEGQVRVTSTGTALREQLKAGEWLRVSWAGDSLGRGQLLPEEAAAWRDGRLVVEDRPLTEVIGALRRYYRGLIVTADDELSHLSITGTYLLADPIAALRAAAYPHGVVVRQVMPWVVIVSKS
jgi:transmembrane sensor